MRPKIICHMTGSITAAGIMPSGIIAALKPMQDSDDPPRSRTMLRSG